MSIIFDKVLGKEEEVMDVVTPETETKPATQEIIQDKPEKGEE